MREMRMHVLAFPNHRVATRGFGDRARCACMCSLSPTTALQHGGFLRFPFFLDFFSLLLFRIRAVLCSFPLFVHNPSACQSPPKAPVSTPNHPQTSPKCPNHPQTTPNRPETRSKHTTPPWDRERSEPPPTLRTPQTRRQPCNSPRTAQPSPRTALARYISGTSG